MPLTAAEWLSENSERQELALQNIPLAMELYAKYVASFAPKDVVEAINEKYHVLPNMDIFNDMQLDRRKAALHGYSLAAGESVKFAEWKDKHCQRFGDRWGTLYAGDGGKLYTTAQLFHLFKKESNG